MFFKLKKITKFSIFISATLISFALFNKSFAQTPPAAPAASVQSNSAWPRSQCAQLQSIGSPAPAWLHVDKNNMKTETLLTIINYQMALSLCQQEQLVSLVAEQSKQLKNDQSSKQDAAILKLEKATMALKEQISLLGSQIANKNESAIANPIPQTIANNAQNLAPSQNAPTTPAKNMPGSAQTQNVTLVQDSALPPIERAMLRLIDLMEQHIKQTNHLNNPPITNFVPAPPQPMQ